jgi:hypothetical protein
MMAVAMMVVAMAALMVTLSCDPSGVHPYGRNADGWPSASWGFGEVTPLLNSYVNASES